MKLFVKVRVISATRSTNIFDSFSHPSKDIRLCNIRSIKENDSKADRRFCFEIQMPNRSLLLQAENAETRDIWVSVLNKAVGYYLNQGNQRKSSDGNSNGNIQSPTLRRVSKLALARRCSQPISESNIGSQ